MSSSVLDLVRPEILALSPYVPAIWNKDSIRLSANEAPWTPRSDDHSSAGLNLYPEPRPTELTAALARHYGVAEGRLLVTRGSSDGIDLLLRCFCRPGQDEIVICPPTFGMYSVYADIQGAVTREAPLIAARGFALDHEGIAAVWNSQSKLLFICSPNNPTGNRIPTDELHALCDTIGDTGIVVVDGAYTEFANTDPTSELLDRHNNVVLLRTLSKAFGLAGIRCGSLLASEKIVEIMSRVLSPFCFPTPCQDVALECLATDDQSLFSERIAQLRFEREKMTIELLLLPEVHQVWSSEANFILARVTNAKTFTEKALAGGVSIRDFSWTPYTADCVRITIGSPEQNRQLINALIPTEIK